MKASDEIDDLPGKGFLTTREAAAVLGVTVRTVQLWAEAGLLEAWKTSGGHRRIFQRSVDRLLASRATSEPAQRTESASLKILLVEDDPAVLRVWEQKIARWPMQPQVQTARNGFEALVRLGLSTPDLLITDLNMPEIDGFQMLQQLKNIPELAVVTVVVVTGLDDAQIEARGGVPPGIPVLRKPMPFDQLRDIATVIASRTQPLHA